MRKLAAAITLLFPIISYATIIPKAQGFNSTCAIVQPCQVRASHSLHIINDTPIEQTYHYTYLIITPNGQAVRKVGEITLDPGQDWWNTHNSIGYFKFATKGRHPFTVSTEADGYEHNKATVQNWADVS